MVLENGNSSPEAHCLYLPFLFTLICIRTRLLFAPHEDIAQRRKRAVKKTKPPRLCPEGTVTATAGTVCSEYRHIEPVEHDA